MLNQSRNSEQSHTMEYHGEYQKEIHSGLHGRLQGTTRESLEAMLTNRGMSNKEATALTDKLYNTSLDRGKAHNLHRRNRWDMQKQYAYQGQVYTLADFADHNIMENLQELTA